MNACASWSTVSDSVTAIEMDEDGMLVLKAFLPAPGAAAVEAVLTGIAHGYGPTDPPHHRPATGRRPRARTRSGRQSQD